MDEKLDNACRRKLFSSVLRTDDFEPASALVRLLCTNGLTDMVPDDEIADTLASRRTPQEQCDVLVDAALANGGSDNVTVVLANYHIPKLEGRGA